MSKLQHLLDRLSTLPQFEAERGASPDEIHRIEQEVGVVLPTQYLEFLRRFGYAAWFGRQILGVRPIDRLTWRPSTVVTDCVSRTKEERDPSNPIGTSHLPREHIVIATDGGGGNYVLFTSGAPHEGEVHHYNFEDQAEPIRTWPSFADFLKHEIEEAVGGPS